MNDWVKARWLATNPGPFKVGDRVRYMRVFTPVEGVIIEDRGNLGVGGRRVYRLRVQLEEGHEIETELPDDKLTLVADDPKGGEDGRQR